jgi:glutathione-specific gamma-glutamylcyclotransferase
MPRDHRQMRLTPELVAKVARPMDDPGDAAYPDVVWATDADRAEVVAELRAAGPANGEVWVFAYGSLIWNPPFAFSERRVGRVRGWHRSFCMGWITRYRGTPEQPGLILVLDHGGECEGIAYRLPAEEAEAGLRDLFGREMRGKPDPMRAIWADVETDGAPVRAITFVIDREGHMYVAGLSEERTADVLSLATGHVGSMADYLYQTVKGLEEAGIHDAHLWRLQELVAERIEAAHPGA